MATIRPYQWQVEPGATSTPNLPENAMINVGRQVAQLGQQVARTTQDVSKIIQQEKMENDKVAVRDYFNKARNSAREYMAGLYAKKNKDGIHVYDEAREWYKAEQESWSKTITDQNQRQLFAEKFDAMAAHHFDTAMSHQMSQRENWDIETKREDITQSKQDAVANRGNAALVDSMAVSIEDRAMSIYKNMGTEYAAKKAKEHVSDMYEKQLTALADDDPVKAKEHYERVKNFINGENQERIEESIENMSLLGQAQQRTDAILASTDDETRQLAMAREEKDPNIRKMVEDMVNARMAETKKIEAIKHQAYMSDMLNKMQAAGTREKAIEVAYSATKGDDKLDLKRVVDVFYPTAETKAQTNYNVLMNAMDMIDAGKKFTRTELLVEAFPYLSDSHRDKLEEYNRTGGVKGKLTINRVKSVFKTIDQDEAEDGEKLIGMYEFVEKNLGEEAPTDASIKKLISDSMLEGQAEDYKWWTFGIGRDMTYAEAVATGRSYEWLPDVTGAEKESITAILKSQGIDVNPLSIGVYKKHEILKRPYPPPEWRPPVSDKERKKISDHLIKLGKPPTDNNIRKYKMKFIMGYPVKGGIDAY